MASERCTAILARCLDIRDLPYILARLLSELRVWVFSDRSAIGTRKEKGELYMYGLVPWLGGVRDGAVGCGTTPQGRRFDSRWCHWNFS
jgi:hypothetical protein